MLAQIQLAQPMEYCVVRPALVMPEPMCQVLQAHNRVSLSVLAIGTLRGT
jgi:hypothetical protein